MKTFRFLAGVFLVAALGPALPADDWKQFRGPGGSGVAATAPPTAWGPKQNLLWQVSPPGVGTSSPIVVGDKVYLTAATDAAKRHVLCLDAASGKTLWTADVAGKLPEQDKIRENHGYASSTLACDGERLFAFFGKSGVFAFDLAGKQLWRADVGDGLHGWGTGASPVVHGDHVLVNASVESGSLVALDRKTGKEAWRAHGIAESWATPLLVPLAGGKTEVVVPVVGKLLAFDPATGEELWRCDTGIESYMAPSPIAHDGVVYVVGGRTNGSLAVRAGGRGDVTKTHRLWTSKDGSNVSSPVYHAGHVFWMNDKAGVAYCVEAATGKTVYKEQVGRAAGAYASALLADGKVHYLDRTGRTFVVPAGPKFEVAATVESIEPRGMFNASPVAAGGRLYLRSEKNLYCVGAK